ncbi:TraB/GumN family protein [Roseiconus lacunae]|uniref:TraB/GumN family protein n=1 Tax=Roseiconus lacunae TaxID=2605694 RepID=UPI001E33CA94|nr:TraB/GumN family protein [Roseiconus lacunae]MCD0458817.1 TraB/GumN family protein [Roseiconus lacunae]WRQ52402.1 TraB/GumN family protein [Stieleria sp. HD01]
MQFSLRIAAAVFFVAVAIPAALRAQTAAPAKESAAAKGVTEADSKSDDESKRAGSEGEKYLRITEDDKGRKLALQTAIVRYEGKPGTRHDGAIVDLVGVVHIGEREYYKDLNTRLGKYDSVLYELVAPDGTRIRPEDLKRRRSIVASMQSGMKDMLKLEYQLERIDYMAENFRHADMSPEEFSKDLERRGDSVVKMFARMMGAGLATQAKSGGDVGVLMALFSNDRPTAMKNAMARQLIDMEAVTTGINDANGENTLIKGRNAKAFEVLREELADGKETLAVFYGAGHLSDMAERLEKDFGMEAKETVWLDAWDLQSSPASR